MLNNKTAIFVRGLPGSGKTTFAELLEALIPRAEAYAADDFFMENGEYKFDQAKLAAAHGWCQSQTADAMRKGLPVIVHNTFTTEKELKPYLKLAEEHGYNVVSIIVENRHGNTSVHGVPEEVMEKMENRFSVKLREKTDG